MNLRYKSDLSSKLIQNFKGSRPWWVEVRTSNLSVRITTLVLCAIWYHFYNFKNVKDVHGVVLLLVAFAHGCFSRFLNDTKSRKASQLLMGMKELFRKNNFFSFLERLEITLLFHTLL